MSNPRNFIPKTPESLRVVRLRNFHGEGLHQSQGRPLLGLISVLLVGWFGLVWFGVGWSGWFGLVWSGVGWSGGWFGWSGINWIPLVTFPPLKELILCENP
jgi:hypothetical protein